jgi:hypothetical protein
LKLGITGATSVPNAANPNALVPVMVEDAHRIVLSDEINSSISSFNEFTVVCEILRVYLVGIQIGSQQLHIASAK